MLYYNKYEAICIEKVVKFVKIMLPHPVLIPQKLLLKAR